MKILGLDFETQCDKPATTRVTEIGAILYDWDPLRTSNQGGTFLNPLEEIERYSTLCYEPDYPPQSEKIADLTGISDEMLKTSGRSRLETFARLITLVHQADIVLAHKIAFDKTILESTGKLLGLGVPEKEWLCTLTNFPWPTRLTCHKLSHLAYEHGILKDPATLHRAVNDIELMMELVFTKYDFNEVLKYARAPWIYAKATVIEPWKDQGRQTGAAKFLGFSFESVKGTDQPKWPKTWVTRIKGEEKFEKLVESARLSEFPFRVSRIEGIE